MKPRDVESGLTASRLREVVSYDHDSGKFYWLKGNNQKKAGDEAGSLENTGYVRITVDGLRYQAHRLAWLYVTGEWPKERIDHRNLCRSDNRWDNLREATDTENKINTCVTKRNFLGIKGIRLHEGGRYMARITKAGITHYLGLFDTSEEASAAYHHAAKVHHREFARAK